MATARSDRGMSDEQGRNPETPEFVPPDHPLWSRQPSGHLDGGELPTYELLLDQSPALEFLKDESGRLVYYNRAFETNFAADGNPLVGKIDSEWLPAEVAERVRLSDQTVLATGAVLEVEETLPSPNGLRHWLVLKFPLRSDSGRHLLGNVAVDISERRRREATLARMAAIMESSHDAVIATAPDGRVISWNPGAAQMYGYTVTEMEGRSIRVLEPPGRRGEIQGVIERIAAGENVVRYETVRVKKDGDTVEVAVSASPIRDEHGALTGVASIARDISDRKRAEELIAFQAFHDPLTALPNRAFLMERLEFSVGKARRTGKLLALLFLDLDLFKTVNDGFGHTAGDAIFQEVARRLSLCVREGDTVARVGGDEFIVLLPEITTADDAIAVARKLLEAVAQPYVAGNRRVDLTTSIGISLYPDDGQDPEALLRSGENAMARAKFKGRNNFQLNVPELTEEAARRLALQAGLRQAIQRNELVLHYQPVLSLISGRIIELEALVRWQHPEKGLVMPGDFIEVAEKAGMMVPLGQWVLSHAARQLRLWQERGLPDLRVAVNLSPSQFHERNLVSTVQRALSDSNLKPQALEIEITEGVAMEDADVTVANLLALRDLDVGISIDDFGTGYSSLSYLKRFPVTTLKIDRSFVSDVVSNSADAGIVRAVLAMAHGLKLNVIAEGVETHEQFAYLRSSGCDALQGYWFSRPLPVEAVDKLLAEELERWTPKA
ncbi:MAG TPA: EAL domain-containing protein [Thermoanaerobaculia bacterium]|nr:EAL domain-containing protein [Thermoanaerobaculia bacterium]